MRLVPLILLAVFYLGCSEPTGVASQPPAARDAEPGGLALTADAEAYARGDTAHLTLRNGTEATYGMGVLECAALQRPAGDGWEQSPAGNERVCIQVYRYLAPGETMEADVALDVPPGTYRFTHSVAREGGDAGEAVATEPFEVRP